MVNVVAAEDLARKAAEELKKLSGKNPKAEQFAECSALTRLIKDALNLEAKANVDATFVARVLRLVVGVECQAAVIFHKTGNSHEIRKNDCCLIAAAGELLSMVDDRLFEKVWRRIWKAANWEDVLKMKKSLTLVKSIQLRAAVWVGKTSYKTGERVNKFVFPIFVNAIVRRLSGDKELRDNLRSLALADASETVAPLNDATGPVPASSTQVLTPASSAVTADEVRLLRNLARSVQSKANHFLESARSDYYDFEVKWSVVRGVSWVSEDAALSEMLGRSPSELPRTISELAAFLHNTPQARLVILGEGGAGKTSLAAELARQMVKLHQDVGGLVPVVLEISNWRNGQNADEWLTEQLANKLTSLRQDSGSGTSWAEDLISQPWVFPILDGFDEIPLNRRRGVLNALNFRNQNRGFLLLSRIDEYKSQAPRGGVVLRAVTVLQLEPLSVDEIRRGLRRSGAKWTPVLAELDPPTAAGKIVLEVLSLPLMLVLAGETYGDGLTDPVELLQVAASNGAQAVREKILEAFVDVKYRAETHNVKRDGKIYPATGVRRWLGFLAADLMVQETTDFVWWERKTFDFSLPVLMLIGISFWLAVISGIYSYLVRSGPAWAENIGIYSVCLFVSLPFLVIYSDAAEPRAPRRVPGVKVKNKLNLLPWIVVAVGVLIAYLTASPVIGICSILFLAAPLLWTPVAETRTRNPHKILRDDLLAGAIRFGVSGVGMVLLVVAIWLVTGDRHVLSYVPVAFTIAVILALASSFSSWLIVTTGLRWRRLGPRDYMRFLAQACDKKGVLRQSEGTYQFRHAILQEYLARRFVKDSQRSERPLWQGKLVAFRGRHSDLSSEAVTEEFHRLMNATDDNPRLVVKLWQQLVEVLLDLRRPKEALVELQKLHANGVDRKVWLHYRSEMLYIEILRVLDPSNAAAVNVRNRLAEKLNADQNTLKVNQGNAVRKAREELHARGLFELKCSTANKDIHRSARPKLVSKVRDIVGLYVDPPANALALAVDQKSQIPALYEALPIGDGMPTIPVRMTHIDTRNGSTSLFATLDISSGSVIARHVRRHRHRDFLRFLKIIDSAVPPELDLHVICDYYATHKVPIVKIWLLRHSRFHLRFTPTDESWLELVERYSAELATRTTDRSAYRGITGLETDIRRWINAGDADPTPFVWTKTSGEIRDTLVSYCQETNEPDTSTRTVE